MSYENEIESYSRICTLRVNVRFRLFFMRQNKSHFSMRRVFRQVVTWDGSKITTFSIKIGKIFIFEWKKSTFSPLQTKYFTFVCRKCRNIRHVKTFSFWMNVNLNICMLYNISVSKFWRAISRRVYELWRMGTF